DGDRVDVFGLFVEHDAKVLVAPRLGKGPKRTRGHAIIHIAEGDDVGSIAGMRGNVPTAHPTRADPRQVHALARRQITGATQNVSRDDGETKGQRAAGSQERASGALTGGDLLRRLSVHWTASFKVRGIETGP